MANVNVSGQSPTAGQMKEFWGQVDKGLVTRKNFQKFLEEDKRENPYLRLISGGEVVKISACKGGPKANLANAQKTFSGCIDPDFNNYGINLPQPATEKTDVDVYEMYNKDADPRTLFGSLNSDLKSLAFKSQEQIEAFCQENKQWLRKDSRGTFFLFTEDVDGEEKFFVAIAGFVSGGLGVRVRRLSDGLVWIASGTHRVVVPTTKTLDSKN